VLLSLASKVKISNNLPPSSLSVDDKKLSRNYYNKLTIKTDANILRTEPGLVRDTK
jgi:hypothetical protein